MYIMLEFLAIVHLAVQFRLGRRAFETLIEGSARTVKGRLARDVDAMGERIFRQSVADLANQVVPVARYLGIEYIVCNRLVADEHGVLTSEIMRFSSRGSGGPLGMGRRLAGRRPRHPSLRYSAMRASYGADAP